MGQLLIVFNAHSIMIKKKSITMKTRRNNTLEKETKSVSMLISKDSRLNTDNTISKSASDGDF